MVESQWLVMFLGEMYLIQTAFISKLFDYYEEQYLCTKVLCTRIYAENVWNTNIQLYAKFAILNWLNSNIDLYSGLTSQSLSAASRRAQSNPPLVNISPPNSTL